MRSARIISSWFVYAIVIAAPAVCLAAPGVSITQSGGTTGVDEMGPTSDSYTIVLDELPSANVEIIIDPDDQTDIGAGPGSPILLTFTPGNWNVLRTVTVTAVDDSFVEGPHTSTITHGASSTDLGYDGIAIPNVVATVADNDMPGIVVTESGGSTAVSEAGSTADSYDIVLNSRPTAAVSITVNCDSQVDLGLGPGVSISVVIGASSWDLPRTVFVTAVDDAFAEGPHTSTITHTVTSGDSNYNAYAIPDIVVSVTDNDAAGIKVTESGGSTDVREEGTTSDTYTLEMLKAPSATVAVTLDPDDNTDLGAGAGVAIQLDFTTVNWSVARQVTVTAVDDANSEGPHTSTITHTAVSSDGNYNGISIASVTANVIDNDVSGVTVTQSAGSTNVTEAGPTSDTYTIVLDSQPGADVVITVDPDEQTSVGMGSDVAVDLTFTSGNWDTPQTVTVTAVDDAISEGAHTSTIVHTSVSADGAYDAIMIADVVANVADNESAGVSITQSGGTTNVAETGPTSDSYTIELNSEPTADVVITVDPDAQTDIGMGAGVAGDFTFTSVNWNTPQTVTVTAVDDAVAEGGHTSTITHAVASADGVYNGFVVSNVVANVTDNDTAGVTIVESGGSTDVDETGPTNDTYTVVLNSQPTASVTIAVDPDVQTDLGAGAGAVVNLTFTTGNWNMAQTVTVTAVDDQVDEGVHTSTITHTATSGDGVYNGISVSSIVAGVADNDTAGVTITQSGGSTNVAETGPTSDTYTVVLNTKPTASVTINVDPDGQSEVGAGAGTAINLTFTTGNWSSPQTVTVTAVNDAVFEGPHTSTIVHSGTSGDGKYNGIGIGNVVANITDNDTIGVSITESAGSTDIDEAGPTSDSYDVVLDTQPSADVVITVDPDDQSDIGMGAGVAIDLTFTNANWDTPQTVTVTAIDDLIDEGAHDSIITHTAASGDGDYDAIAIVNVVADITDNDTAAVTITQSGGSTGVDETGPTSDTYDVVLESEPTADVVIAVDPDVQSDVGAGAGTAINLTFTAANWDTPQTVTVTAVDDASDEGAHSSTITHTATSADVMYDGIAIANVVASVIDNDLPGVTITELGGTTDVDETGPTSDTYTVVLDSMPSATVTITVDPDPQTNLGAGAGTAITLTFLAGAWNTPQMVTVTAVDDAVDEGAHTSTITHTAASGDGDYAGIAINDVVANVADNDMAGITVTESAAATSVSETGPTTDTYTIVLDSQPTADVVITVDPDGQTNLGSGAGVAVPFTYTAANWNVPRTVVVTAVDDAAPEGPHTGTITHTVVSGDTNYDAAVIADVTVSITDNDLPGVTLVQSGGSTQVSEVGPTSDSYTIVLDSELSVDVVITVDPDAQTDLGAGPGTAIDLTFTSANWNAPQTVTVTAVDDADAEGAHTSTITHTATSADGDYDGIVISDVVASVTDNDAAGVTISESASSTDVDETGPSADSYTLVLDSQPTGDVTITADPDAQTDLGMGAGAAITLTFTAGNWNTPQTVVVTAVDDDVDEGGHTSTITHSAASADGNYNGLGIASVVANVTDNDMAGVTIVESAGSTDVDETGPTSDTYTIVLDSEPTANVTITIDPDAQSDLGSGSGTAIMLTFTPANWDTPRLVTVTAVDDDVDEDAHTSTITHAVASADGVYNGFAVASVTADITDNDTAGVTITESGGGTLVDETGPTTDTYTIVLDSQPTGSVMVTVDPDEQTDLGAGADTAIVLTFTTANWDSPRTVVVTAVDDATIEGPHMAVVMHSVASSDAKYNGLAVSDLTASVVDNDLPGVTISQTSGDTTVREQGPTSDSYTIVLTSPPTASVTITVTPDAETQVGAGAGAPISFTFGSGDWNIPRTVVVTAIDDTIPEGVHSSTITHAAVSGDTDYDGIVIPDVTVSIDDNDGASLVIDESDAITQVSEGSSTTDAYTVRLASEPLADVTLTVSPDQDCDLGAGAGTAVQIVFTTANWSTPQTVTVAAVDDSLVEGVHSSTITHSATSGDSAYDGISVVNVVVQIADNDSAGVTITESSGSTSVNESGATSDTYTIVLTAQPTANVTIAVDPDIQTNLGSGAGASIALVFTAANWSTPRTVTVRAVDDSISEGNHSSRITHTVSSGDSDYSGLSVPDLFVSVTDNDRAGVRISESDDETVVNESGPTSDDYTLVLDSQPLANVRIRMTPDEQTDLGAGQGQTVSRTFTPSNWNTPQTVTVTAIDDSEAEGTHISRIVQVVNSGDAAYDALPVPTLVAIVLDNDGSAVNSNPGGGEPELPDEALIADAGDDVEIYIGDTVTVSGIASRTAEDATIVDYTWNLGGTRGEYVRGEASEWTFGDLGEFEITLTVQDSRGRYAIDTVLIRVVPFPPVPPAPLCGNLCGVFGLTNLAVTLGPVIAVRELRKRKRRRGAAGRRRSQSRCCH